MKDQLEALVAQMYSSGILYSEAVREFKKRFIINVLQQHKGNQTKAARDLGMSRNTLGRTIAELKLDIREFKEGLRRPVHSGKHDLSFLPGDDTTEQRGGLKKA